MDLYFQGSYPSSFTTLMTNKMSLLRHWGRKVLYNPLLSLLGSCWRAIKYGAAKTPHQTVSENHPSMSPGFPWEDWYSSTWVVIGGPNVQDEAKAMLRSLRSRAATSWGAVAKKGTTSGKRWDSEIFTPAIWRCLLVATSDFLGLGAMSKGPWIHCWRVLCVPFLHCQRGNF